MPILSDSLLEELDKLQQQTAPLDYVAQFSFAPEPGYGCIAQHARNAEKAIPEAQARALLNRYLTSQLLESFDPEAGPCHLPPSIKLLYPRELERITKQLTDREDDFYRLDHDPFIKDLAILSHRLIPLGAEYACPHGGVSRSLLFRDGLSQLLRGGRAVLMDGGGFRPWFELHAHVLALEEFNPQGWQETSLRLAQLLESNPVFRGAISSSWFLDPQLKDISPRLNYLREDSIKQGATFLLSSTDTEGKSGALAKSPTRRRLFEAGSYTPKIYTRVWPRSKLIAWKNEQAPH